MFKSSMNYLFLACFLLLASHDLRKRDQCTGTSRTQDQRIGVPDSFDDGPEIQVDE